MNVFIRYVVTIGIIGFFSGTILYIIYNKVFSVPHDTLSFSGSLAYAYGLLFITYNAYLLFKIIFPGNANNLLKQAAFCFLFEIALWSLPLTLAAGFDSRAIFINVTTVGLHSIFIPYLYNFLGMKLNIK
ncbi:hypothetical protein [Mucilaginibacter humi]|uniref:hypothetical protein n=1 Tax=Mucilaginibacter humi TaxID=2732510 RepID=UPI0015857D1B|nr:hypothetical protein [Mucilaginibacter humi]